MSFIVYNPTTRVVAQAPRLQAEADAAVAADADLTADAVDRDLPDEFEPGWYFTAASELVPELPLLEASIRLQWKQDLAVKAKMVDEAIKSHWANQTRRQSQWEVARTIDDARSLDNTFDWARLWVGLPWLEILKAEGDATALALEMVPGPPAVTAALTHAGVEEVVNQGRAELPNYDHIYFWYAAHNPTLSWTEWLDDGKVYITNADGTGTPWKVARYFGIAEATRMAITVDYYGAARNYAAGIGV